MDRTRRTAPPTATNSNALIRTEIPFVLPARIPATGRTRCGHGVIVRASAGENQPTTVVHSLKRRIQAAWCIANNDGAYYTANLKFGLTVNDGNSIDLTGDVQMVNALVVLF